MLKDSKSRIIILLTDGDNNKGDIEPVPAAQVAAAIGAKIYTIGLGIEEPCKLPSFDPDTGKLKRDAAGEFIPTITLQPANYTVLGGDGAARPRPVVSRQEPRRTAEHLQRN